MKGRFKVGGMTCSSCVSHIEKAINELHGVNHVSVSLLTNTMTVDYESSVKREEIIRVVEKCGYKAEAGKSGEYDEDSFSLDSNSYNASVEANTRKMYNRFVVSLIFFIPLMYISMGHMIGLPLPWFLNGTDNSITYAMVQFLLTLPIIYANIEYFISGLGALIRKTPNMDSLISIGSIAATGYGIFAICRIGYGLGIGDIQLVSRYHMDLYFESAASILTLITLGKYLEVRSKGKTGEAISRLLDLAPKTALVERDGAEVIIPADDVAIGDIVIVKSGGRIPVDGVIEEGETSIDESSITGESIPVEKKKGDPVIASTVNKSGYIKFKATRVGRDTTLSQIIQLVEQASTSKAPIAKLADKISGVFVPAVIIIAFISMIIWLIMGQTFEFALSIGIAVLVISCPCALGLATPVAIMVGTGIGAENGILIKSAQALETAHEIDCVVLDKTGTVTEGKPRVTDIIPLDGRSVDEFIKLASSIEKPSEHPLAGAVVKYAISKGIDPFNMVKFRAIFGRGVTAESGGKVYFAGNSELMSGNGIDCSLYQTKINKLSEEGKTPLLFAEDKKLIGIIAVADTVKDTSYKAISEIKDMGIDVIMLTGDNERTANAVKNQVGIDRVVSGVLPQGKENEIVRIKKEYKGAVAMVGDGVNDAPALARSDVGIAIGAGTDVAIESSDIVLMKSNLIDIPIAIRLSREVIKNIKQNLFWAFFYNVVGIPLAAGVFYGLLGWRLNPMFAAAAMSLSSICVVINALRLRTIKIRSSGKD